MQNHRIVDMVKSNDNGEQVYEVNEDIASGYISADEYRKLDIKTIQFKGPYKYLLGEPGVNFYMIITGAPGHGKSTFCVVFATYFSLNHGKTLYLPAEQRGKNADLKNMLNRTDGERFILNQNPNKFDTIDKVIGEVKRLRFKLVVFDSINYMKFTPSDIAKLRAACPDLAILSVMQYTKEGNFRGSLEHKHDCDIFLTAKEFSIYQEKARSAVPTHLPLERFSTFEQ